MRYPDGSPPSPYTFIGFGIFLAVVTGIMTAVASSRGAEGAAGLILTIEVTVASIVGSIGVIAAGVSIGMDVHQWRRTGTRTE